MKIYHIILDHEPNKNNLYLVFSIIRDRNIEVKDGKHVAYWTHLFLGC